MAGDVMTILTYLSVPDSTGYSDNNDGTYSVTFADQDPRLVSDAELLVAAKLQKTDKLKSFCKQNIESGFYSLALGASHKYDSALPQDQTNLIGAKLAGIGMKFTCTDLDGLKTERTHTAEQIVQVFTDGMLHIQTQKAKYYEKINAITNAANLTDIEAVSWE